MSTVTTHVLDTALGGPAANVPVRLERVTAEQVLEVARAATDGDGRVRELGPHDLPAGTYRLVFGTGDYFAATGREAFYPQVTVDFTIADPDQHYHVPLLLGPFGFTTYRGS